MAPYHARCHIISSYFYFGMLFEHFKSEKFIIYPNAYITFKMDLDPFSSETSKEWVYDRDLPSKKFNEGSIFIWDSHLGPNEGGVLEEELLNDKRLELLKTFYPDTPFKVLGGRYFEIRVYRIN